jgi:putative DNA primase/helicase
MELDFEQLARELLASQMYRHWLPDGKQEGSWWVARNPVRQDKRAGSFKVNMADGGWMDWADDRAKGGDLVSLYAYLHGIKQADAARQLGAGDTRPPVPLAPMPVPKATKAPAVPIPEGKTSTFQLRREDRWFSPVKRWTYLDASGRELFHVCRYDLPEGGKDVIPWRWLGERIGQGAWPDERPLYGLPWLVEHPTLPVLVVEGEKCAEHAQQALGEDWCVVTWQGGTGAVAKTDWSPLRGRNVVLWPDADEPGYKAMEAITKEAAAGSLRLVHIPEGAPKGWDCADIADDAELLRVMMAEGPAKAPSIEGMSEDDMALRFEEAVAGRLLWETDRGKWWEYVDGVWQFDVRKAAQREARALVRSLTEGFTLSDSEKYRRLTYITHVSQLAESAVGLQTSATAFDADLMLAGLPGGMAVDLRTGATRPATEGDRLTKQLGAQPGAAPPTRWLRFLHEATGGDVDFVAYLQRVVGYCLTGSVREHALFFVYGAGGNGKSVFLDVLGAVLGAYHRNSPAETFASRSQDKHPEELARLQGARLVTASETETDRAWAEARIKALTGGDLITARRLNENSVTWRPQFKLIIAGNSRPRLRVVDEAMKRRFHILPFVVTPKAPDQNLRDRIIADELPGVVAWAIEGCRLWQEQGLQRPEVVQRETLAYLESQDLLGQWLEECCVTGTGWKGQSSGLFASWQEWSESQGERAGSNKAFSEAMEKRGFRKEKSNGAMWWRGVGIQPKADPYDPRHR